MTKKDFGPSRWRWIARWQWRVYCRRVEGAKRALFSINIEALPHMTQTGMATVAVDGAYYGGRRVAELTGRPPRAVSSQGSEA